MTQKEIDNFLACTKIYVAGKSKEIQEKLFSFGFSWGNNEKTVFCKGKPFLFLNENKEITWGEDMNYFEEHKNREITAEEILALKLIKSTYRPFRTQEECWQEMLKHHPFGWIKNEAGNIFNIIAVLDGSIKINECYSNYTNSLKCKFIDGTVFGVEEK